ncbi:MAG: hypothetical protein EXS10_04760 [Phycisphaerales bacterium]|nr:hypothetical protein [Phycisphaerales bacterium]
MASRSHYEVLGVATTATASEIRTAHRKLARQHHPDLNKAPDAGKRFAEIQEAYDTLSDAEKRRKYDEFQRLGGNTPFGGSSSQRSGARAQWGGADPTNYEDIFSEAFGQRGGFGGGGTGRAARGGPQAQRRQSAYELEVTVPFDLAVKGGTWSVLLDDGARAEFVVAKGASEGDLVNPIERIDFIIKLAIGTHAWFTRDGLDLQVHVPVSITEATLGAKIDVPTLGGLATVSIPASTASGKRIRLKGQGIEREGAARGDLYATIDIVPPETLTELDRQLLGELGKRLPNPRARAAWAKSDR